MQRFLHITIYWTVAMKKDVRPYNLTVKSCKFTIFDEKFFHFDSKKNVRQNLFIEERYRQQTVNFTLFIVTTPTTASGVRKKNLNSNYFMKH